MKTGRNENRWSARTAGMLLSAALVGLMPGWVSAAESDEAERLSAEIERATETLRRAARDMARLQGQRVSYDKKSRRAMLGVLLGDHHRDTKVGVTIVGTTPGSGAAEMGMLAGDIIVKVDGKDLTSGGHPHEILAKHMKTVSPGDVVVLDYLREGERAQVAVTTKAHADLTQSMMTRALDGLDDIDIKINVQDWIEKRQLSNDVTHVSTHSEQLLDMDEDLAAYFGVKQGVLVLKPDVGSELKAGDVILAVGAETVKSAQHAASLLHDLAEPEEVEVRRQDSRQDVTVQPHEFAQVVSKEIHVIKLLDGEEVDD